MAGAAGRRGKGAAVGGGAREARAGGGVAGQNRRRILNPFSTMNKNKKAGTMTNREMLLCIREMRLIALRDLVEEAVEVVADAPSSGAAGARWREEWLRRAAGVGVTPMRGVRG